MQLDRRRLVLFFICFSLSRFVGVVDSSLNLFYREAEYEHRLYIHKSLVFDAFFDNDVTLSVDYTRRCPKTLDFQNPLSISPCCPALNCYTPTTGEKCLDSNGLMQETLTIDPQVGVATKSYKFNITFVSVPLLLVSAVPQQGVIYLNIHVNSTQLSPVPTINSAAVCLPSDVMGHALEVTVDVIAMLFTNVSTTITYSLYIDNDGIPLERYPFLADVQLSIDSIPVVSCTPYEGSSFCNLNITHPSANESFYYYLNSVVESNKTFSTNQFTFEILSLYHNIETEEISESFSWDLLADGTAVISVTFNNLNSNGKQIDGSFIATQRNNSCNYEGLQENVIEFQEAQNALDRLPPPKLSLLSVPSSYSVTISNLFVDWAFNRLYAPIIKESWVACVTYVQTELLKTTLTAYENITHENCPFQQGTPNWQVDPCCNVALRSTQCCVMSVTTESIATYTPQTKEYLTRSLCSIYGTDCTIKHLKVFSNYQSGAESCAADLKDDNPTTVSQIYDQCAGQLYTSECVSDYDCITRFGDNSFCGPRPGESKFYWGTLRTRLPLKICRWKCSDSSDCYYGKCIDVGGLTECHFNPTNDPYLNPDTANQISQCIATKVLGSSAFFQRNFLAMLNLTMSTSSVSSVTQAIYLLTTTQSPCSLNIVEDPTITECVNNAPVQTCNWHTLLYPVVPSLYTQYDVSICETDGQTPALQSSSYCAYTPYEFQTVFPDVTQNGVCMLLTTRANWGLYEVSSSSLSKLLRCSPPTLSNFGSTTWRLYNFACYWQTLTTDLQDSCLVPRFCPPSSLIPINNTFGLTVRDRPPSLMIGWLCPPRCILIRSPDQVSCQGVGSWNSEGNFCEVPASCFEQCLVLHGYWWEGSIYFPKQYKDQYSCNSFCRSDLRATAKSDCQTRFHCSNPFCSNCNSYTKCISSGYCDALPGCYFPLTSNKSCEMDLINQVFSQYDDDLQKYILWTPEGCTVRLPGGITPINQLTCESNNGKYRSYSDWAKLSQDDCENIVRLCLFPNINVQKLVNQRLGYESGYMPKYYPPPDVSFVSTDDCQKCGGSFGPAYNWIAGRLVPNDEEWFELHWQDRAMKPLISKPGNFNVITRDSFISFFNNVDLRREIEYLKQRTNCYWSTVFSEVPTLSCLCRGRNDTATGICNCQDILDLSIIGSFILCSYTPVVLKRTFATVIATKDFTLEDSNTCVECIVKSIDLSLNIIRPALRTYNTGRLFNTQVGRQYMGTILNSNKIIIGQVITNGFTFTYNKKTPDKNFYVCIYIPNYNLDLSIYRSTLDIARAVYTNTTISNLERLHVTVNMTDNLYQGCVEAPEQGYIYIPIGLSNNQDITYVNTLKPQDVATLVIAIILYILAILFGWVMALYDIKKTGVQISNWKKPAGVTFTIAFGLRIAYAAYLLSDPLNESVTIFFIELPSQILWSLSCLLIIRWIDPIAEKGCTSFKGCISKLGIYIRVILFINGVLFIVYLIFMLVPVGKELAFPPGPDDQEIVSPILDQQQEMSGVWYSWYITFCFIALAWFVIIIFATFMEVCTSLFDKNDEYVEKALLVTLLVAVFVFLGQTFMLTRVFLWITFTVYVNWTISQWFGCILVVDLVPLVPMWYCCILNPNMKPDLFQKEEEEQQQLKS